MTVALIEGGVVHALYAEAEPWMDVFDTRDVSAIDGVAEGWTLKSDGSFSAPKPTDVQPSPVPDVSSAQAKIQLSRVGFLAPVKASVEAIGGETEIWFTDARTWQRNNPHVIEIGAGLNLSPDEIDGLFREAAKIDA